MCRNHNISGMRMCVGIIIYQSIYLTDPCGHSADVWTDVCGGSPIRSFVLEKDTYAIFSVKIQIFKYCSPSPHTHFVFCDRSNEHEGCGSDHPKPHWFRYQSGGVCVWVCGWVGVCAYTYFKLQFCTFLLYFQPFFCILTL